MKTLKVMSILSLVITTFAFLVMIACDNSYDYAGGIAWGILLSFWSIAYSIVGLVQAKRNDVFKSNDQNRTK